MSALFLKEFKYFSMKKDITIECTESDQDVREYQINYGGIIFRINFNLRTEGKTLYFDKLNIEGNGPNMFGSKFRTMARSVSAVFCQEFKSTEIFITGTKRTSGKTKNKMLNTMHFRFD